MQLVLSCGPAALCSPSAARRHRQSSAAPTGHRGSCSGTSSPPQPVCGEPASLCWEVLSEADEPDQSLKTSRSLSKLWFFRTRRTSAGLEQLCQESSFLWRTFEHLPRYGLGFI